MYNVIFCEEFYDMLTVHLGIILVNNQLDAHFFFFHICLFQISACFEHPCAHHQENHLYQYDIWCMLLYVGDRLVCRLQICIPDGHLHTVTYTRYRIDTIDSPDDEQMSARNMQRFGINIYEKKEMCVKLVICKNYYEELSTFP